MPEVTLGLAGGFSHGRVITELTLLDSPAVGEPLVITIDPAYWERPRSLTFLLTAGADDAVSDVTLEYRDYDGIPFAVIDSGPALAASTAATYSFLSDWQGASAWSNDIVNAMLPPLFLQGGYQIVVTAVGTFAEGQFTQAQWMRERFITGAGGYEVGRTFQESQLASGYQIVADELA